MEKWIVFDKTGKFIRQYKEMTPERLVHLAAFDCTAYERRETKELLQIHACENEPVGQDRLHSDL